MFDITKGTLPCSPMKIWVPSNPYADAYGITEQIESSNNEENARTARAFDLPGLMPMARFL